MSKINNFKMYFTEVLKDKYLMNKDSIDNYWDYKEKQIKFDNRKLMWSIIGVGELISMSVICIVDNGNNSKVLIPVILLGGIGTLTCKISTKVKNPYYYNKYRLIDDDYNKERVKYKKLNKRK